MFGVEESDRRSGKFKAGPGVPQAMLEMVMGYAISGLGDYAY